MTEVGSFWARRRAAVQAEAEAEARQVEEKRDAARARELAEKDDSDILEEMGLPEPDQMRQGDDFAAFMARDVPEHLRRRALRTLWRSNPVLACVDGLNDYDDDYRADALLREPVKTAYRVGKGLLRHIEEMERKAQAVAGQPEPESRDALTSEAQDQPETASANAGAVEQGTEGEQEIRTAEAGEREAALKAPRHMRFHFEKASG